MKDIRRQIRALKLESGVRRLIGKKVKFDLHDSFLISNRYQVYLLRQRSWESWFKNWWFFWGKESGVKRTRELESEVGVGNSFKQLSSPETNGMKCSHWMVWMFKLRLGCMILELVIFSWRLFLTSVKWIHQKALNNILANIYIRY